MKIREKFDVDAGCIIIASTEFLKKYGFVYNPNSGVLVENVGQTSELVRFRCLDTWDGEIAGEGELYSAGQVFIGDVCYHVEDHNEWCKLLDLTDFFRKPSPEYIRVETGGDGVFEVEVEFLGQSPAFSSINLEKEFIYYSNRLKKIKGEIEDNKIMREVQDLLKDLK